MADRRVKLSGGPDKTVTWIWLDPTGGQVNVEYYDFREPAHTFFGNDIAYYYSERHEQIVFNP